MPLSVKSLTHEFLFGFGYFVQCGKLSSIEYEKHLNINARALQNEKKTYIFGDVFLAKTEICGRCSVGISSFSPP